MVGWGAQSTDDGGAATSPYIIVPAARRVKMFARDALSIGSKDLILPTMVGIPNTTATGHRDPNHMGATHVGHNTGDRIQQTQRGSRGRNSPRGAWITITKRYPTPQTETSGPYQRPNATPRGLEAKLVPPPPLLFPFLFFSLQSLSTLTTTPTYTWKHIQS